MDALKICPKHMSWVWIKEKSKTDSGAKALALLAESVGDEPHRFAGMNKITEWLLDLGAPRFYFEILRQTQTQYANLRFFANEGRLQAQGAIKMGGGIPR